jgi:flagellar motor switch protein FliN/FliY
MSAENQTPSPDTTPEQAHEPTAEARNATATAEPEHEANPVIAPTDMPLEDTGDSDKPLDIAFLLDIPLQVKVEVGRTRMQINDLLKLSQGSVIELQKLVGEPFEVLVNDKLVARGEVVVVNERFGVRLTDIITPMERIQQLA